MRVSWADHARADLRDIRDHIARDSPYYARQFVERILAVVEDIGSYPEIGRLVPEAQRDDVRELLFRGYRIMYLVQPQNLYIIAVLHGSRDLTLQAHRPWEVV